MSEALMSEAEHDGSRQSDLRLLSLNELKVDHSLREDGVDPRHVELLSEIEGHWSPVLVWGPDNLVVDGAHRVAAAKRLGLATILAQSFDGSKVDAFVESVQRNSQHGLPLTLRDRIRATRRIVQIHPEWSDRRIAKVCGLSSTTVGRVRRDTFTADAVPPLTRIGMDGRKHPVEPGTTRQRVMKALEHNPTGSLRTIAAVACASPETVRTVRNSLQTDRVIGSNEPVRSRQATPRTVEQVQPTQRTSVLKHVNGDSALTSCTNSERLLKWLESASMIQRWPDYVDLIPLGRIYELADEAMGLSEQWVSFARALEARGKPKSAVV